MAGLVMLLVYSQFPSYSFRFMSYLPFKSSGYEQASSEANTGSGSSTPDMSMSDVPSGSMGGTQPTGTDSGSSSQESGAYAGADSPDSSIAGTGPGDNDVGLSLIFSVKSHGYLTLPSLIRTSFVELGRQMMMAI